MAFKRRARGGAPSPYPRYLFHGLRAAQLLGSVVVSGIMAYFMYYLREGKFTIPWTFIVLLTISIATITSLLVSILLYNLTYLSPQFNLILNGNIALVWALGLSLLSWSISASHVLQSQCSFKIFGSNEAMGICRDYKALWGMTLCATIATFLALILDIHTYRKTTSRGAYVVPEDDKDAQRLNDVKSMRVRSEGYEVPNDQAAVSDTSLTWGHQEQDIAYHNRYGAEETTGPLAGDGTAFDSAGAPTDMGYHNRFFQK